MLPSRSRAANHAPRRREPCRSTGCKTKPRCTRRANSSYPVEQSGQIGLQLGGDPFDRP